MRQKPLKNAIEFVLCRPSTARHGPGLKHGLRTQWESLEKTNPSFESRYQLEVASVLGVGACVHFPSQSRNPIRHTVMPTLCMLPQFLGICLCVGPAVLRSLVSLLSSSPLALTLFPPPLPQSSLRGGSWWRHPFRTECPKVHSAHCLALGLCICSHLLQENAYVCLCMHIAELFYCSNPLAEW